MEIIEQLKLKELDISQLSKRSGWESLSLDNICQLAEEGHFGLYFKPSIIVGHNERKNYHQIKAVLKSFGVGCEFLDDSARSHHMELKKKFISFCKNHGYLLTHRSGFVRLATASEVEIFPLCENGSVGAFKIQGMVKGLEWNNNFGFVYVNPGHDKPKMLISPGYYFYRSRITEDDLFVFISQIKEFELSHPLLFLKSTSGMVSADLCKLIESKETLKVSENKPIFEQSERDNSFFSLGDNFQIIFGGHKLTPIRTILGLKYYEYLLKRPGERISSDELCRIFHPATDEISIVVDLNDVQKRYAIARPQEVSDLQALSEYKKKLEDLNEDIEDAIAMDDIDHAEILKNERSQIVDEIKKSSYKGRSNTFHSETKNPRSAVQQAMVRAREKIGKQSPELAEYLKVSVANGYDCIYNPPQPIEWR